MRIAFKIPFFPASWCLKGVGSYTILETKKVKGGGGALKVRGIGRRHFASVLIAKHNGKEFAMKEIFCKHWDKEGRKFSKKFKILNTLKIQKDIINIKKVAFNYDGLYSKQKFSFAQFSPVSSDETY